MRSSVYTCVSQCMSVFLLGVSMVGMYTRYGCKTLLPVVEGEARAVHDKDSTDNSQERRPERAYVFTYSCTC